MSHFRSSVPAGGVHQPSPVSELAHGLISACISSTPVDMSPCPLPPEDSDTPTTALVLGPGNARWRQQLRRCSTASSDSAAPRRCSLGAEDSRRRCRTLPLRRRLLAASSAADKENSGSARLRTPLKAGTAGMSPGDWRARQSLQSPIRQPLGALHSPLRQPLGVLQSPVRQPDLPGARLSLQRPSLSGSKRDGRTSDDFCFVAPTNRPPRSHRSANFSSSSFSSTGSSSSSLGSGGWNSPRRPSQEPPVSGSDDGFLSTIDLDTMTEAAMPAALRDLLSAPILHSPVSVTSSVPPQPSFSRCRQQKRCEPPCPPPLLKRPCLLARSESFSPASGSSDGPVSLQRCHSESEASIKRALQRSCQDPDLISDFTRSYALPLCREASSKNIDLRPVSAETVAALLDGQFAESVSSFQIIDCRYPYEFEGGHIRGAVNWYIKDEAHRHLLGPLGQLALPSLDHVPTHKRHVLIFHCEFSSERGPSMFRFVRAQDRHINHHSYPALHYPEMYLLAGGYKHFFSRFPHLCDPCSYKPMNKEGHERDLKHFRAKSKSWAGNSRARAVSKRIVL